MDKKNYTVPVCSEVVLDIEHLMNMNIHSKEVGQQLTQENHYDNNSWDDEE